ncbi:MAG TPA: hypothetical protein ENN90_11365 [Mariniphaga anaerophila]|uniref:Uncharacterized protein n=1 Tax=Mariniphaga anaerophila TaxID=1484053 RepID=A0A831LM83_9BACT|nr:hypothetical protein [Mariniphaga anaerophila]
MKRQAKIIRSSDDDKRQIAIDSNNAIEIREFLNKNNLNKKFDLMCRTILAGIRNTELYDKENINNKCKDVTAMKFKGNLNPRIYCKEVKLRDKTLVIIASELHSSKKNKKNKSKEINLINKVGSYEYEIN